MKLFPNFTRHHLITHTYTFVIIQEKRNIIFLKLGEEREVFNEHLNLERFFQVTVDSKFKEVEMAAFCAFRNAYGNDTMA